MWTVAFADSVALLSEIEDIVAASLTLCILACTIVRNELEMEKYNLVDESGSSQQFQESLYTGKNGSFFVCLAREIIVNIFRAIIYFFFN